MEPLLSLQNLSLYAYDTILLDRISLSLEKGQILGLFGPSGSGKSLLCKSILNLQDKGLRRTGKIFFDGINLFESQNLKQLRGRKISLMFQHVRQSLNPMLTVEKHFQQLGIGDLKALFERVGLHEGQIQKKFSHQLSGGELSRVGLALALAPNPQLLILDEAFASIEERLQGQFIHLLQEEAQEKGRAIILVTHNLVILEKLSTHFIVLESGKITDAGNWLLSRPEKGFLGETCQSYKRLYRS
ncbi:MAG: ABC transporter ATP-binding protein [Candidatus Marinimicrobia bacterium]|nr:ABC transporter ATP-binding protein [Candidatus Neomarinimicrobiota bacterium]